jgi:hypothetical protein
MTVGTGSTGSSDTDDPLTGAGVRIGIRNQHQKHIYFWSISKKHLTLTAQKCRGE